MLLIIAILKESLHLLLESSVYILFGLIISGLVRIFLSPSSVARHLGKGRFKPIFKAALVGIPLPLCSCGVLPAAVSLKKQGANTGAVAAFLISTPESGIDSIAVTYALLDPIMTAARPVCAFVSAIIAGISVNLFPRKNESADFLPDLSCPVDGCCDGKDCDSQNHGRHHTFFEKIRAGLAYAFFDVWKDMAAWFSVGILLAGTISAFIPEDAVSRYLGGGLESMLIMLAIGIPIYICATASTPIAAALILKGVSPGAALVFLLAGPATNITSLTVLFGLLGKRTTAIYLTVIGTTAVIFGLILDQCYLFLGISAKAAVGHAAEIMPGGLKWAGAVWLIALSIKPVYQSIRARLGSFSGFFRKITGRSFGNAQAAGSSSCQSKSCGCDADHSH
jgi:uncharacterized protein